MRKLEGATAPLITRHENGREPDAKKTKFPKCSPNAAKVRRVGAENRKNHQGHEEHKEQKVKARIDRPTEVPLAGSPFFVIFVLLVAKAFYVTT